MPASGVNLPAFSEERVHHTAINRNRLSHHLPMILNKKDQPPWPVGAISAQASFCHKNFFGLNRYALNNKLS